MKRRYGRHLILKQRKLLDQFIKDHFNNIRRGFRLDDYPELEQKLNNIHCFENLPSVAENYVDDKVSAMTRVGLGNSYLDDSDGYDAFGDRIKKFPDYDPTRREDIDKYATDEEKEFLKETFSGSANIETPAEAGYETPMIQTYSPKDGSMPFYNKDNHKWELFVERDDPPAGWCLEFKGKYWEFVHELSQKEADQMLQHAVNFYDNKNVDTRKKITEKWVARLSEVYSDFDEFAAYDEIYGLSKKLGFDSTEDAWLTNPKISGSVDPEEYKRVRESKQLTEKKYGSLYVSQQKILDKFIEKNYHDIKLGGLHFSVDDWPELYNEVASVREAETLWQDINNYVSDKLMNRPWKNRYPWGDSVEKYATDEEKEFLKEYGGKSLQKHFKTKKEWEKYKDKVAKDKEDKKKKKIKESVADQRAEEYIQAAEGDLEIWRGIVYGMSHEEKKDAAFEFKSAINGMKHYRKNWKIPDNRMGDESKKYWGEHAERRDLYRKYLRILIKSLTESKENIKERIVGQDEHEKFERMMGGPKKAFRLLHLYQNCKLNLAPNFTNEKFASIAQREGFTIKQIAKLLSLQESKQLTEAKNTKGKTRKVDDPYETYHGSGPLQDWEWRVLKHWKAPENEKNDPYARVFCAVRSPMTYNSWEYGDTYCREIPGYKYETGKDPLGFGKGINLQRLKDMSDEEIDMIEKMFK